MTEFQQRVRAVILATEPGDVVSYGEVAEEAGFPGAAKAVGNLLAHSDDLPWWRIVPASGRLHESKARRWAALLRAEGVEVVDGRITRPGRRPRRTGTAPPPAAGR